MTADPTTPTTRLLRRVAGHARAQDPGWERTRGAARTLLAVAVGAVPALAVLAVADQALLLAALAGIVAMLGTMTLATAGDQPGRHLVRLAATAAVTGSLAAVLTPWTAISYGAFVAVMAAGAWATRWGPAGNALAMVGFMAYFFALFAQAGAADVPWVVVAAGSGGLGAAAAGMVLLPDRPAVSLRRLVPALLARTSLAVDAAIALVEAGHVRDLRQRLIDRTAGVQELALRIDDLLEDAGPARDHVADPEGLRSAVLVAEGLTDHLAWSVLSSAAALPDAERSALAGQLRRVRTRFDTEVDPLRAPMVPRLHEDGDDRAVEVLGRLAVAAERITLTARPRPAAPAPTQGQIIDQAGSTSATTATAPDPDAPAEEDAPGVDRPAEGLAPNLRKVVQVVLAGTLAIVLGLQLSAAYWYWAVIGAFIVVITTSSRGAGLRKAIDRTAGTTLGVIVGLGLGTLLSGRASVELAVMVALVFAAFWIIQGSYLWMMTLISVMVALLYDVMGIMTAQVLAARVTETALGAALGGAVAFFVLPTSTRRTIDDAVEGLLAALDDLLASVTGGEVELAAVRPLDRAASTLRETTTPLMTSAPTSIGPDVRAAGLLATSVRFRARALVLQLSHQQPDLDAATRRELQALRDTVASLRDHLREPARPLPASPATLKRSPEAGPTLAIVRAIEDRLVAYASSRRLVPDAGQAG